jgi:glucose/arabinose dehydrogenase
MTACSSTNSADAADTDSTAAQPPGDSVAVETRIHLPTGLAATVFAKVPGARAMTLGPDGAVYVSQPGEGRIVRLMDTKGNGVADQQTTAVDGLKRPHGMAFHDGWFYIANTDGVVRVKLDADGKAMGTPVYVNHYTGGGMHWTRTVIFGPDNKMYVSIGSDCNVCEEKDSLRAAVLQYNEDGSGGRLYATGLRNAVGLAVNPSTKQIWAVQNERDNLPPSHENLPPEEINILQDGGDYGWPYCYGDKIPSPEFKDAARCAATIPPALKMQAHSAPLGITFLENASQLPDGMHGDALVTFHGSWNRDVPTGAKVVWIRMVDNKPVRADDFATGWQIADGTRWGRPVDVIVAKDGAVLVSDDAGGVVWRIAKAP